ncbi:MAG: ABC transporter ATP-binding protein [Lachnospiraceae bacterium]|nr:ABC transporter ATP-binding protein [Lachnospiraceae bacterium]
MKIIGIIKSCVIKDKAGFVRLMIINFICCGLSIVVPILNVSVINAFVYDSANREKYTSVCNFLVCLIFSFLMSIILGVCHQKHQNLVELYIQSEILRESVLKNVSAYCTDEIGDIDSLIKQDISTYINIYSQVAFELPFIIIKIFAISVYIASRSFYILIFLLLSQVLIFFIQKKAGQTLENDSYNVRKKIVNWNEFMTDIVFHISTINHIGALKYVLETNRRKFEETAEAKVKYTKDGNIASGLIELISGINLMGVLLVGGYLISKKIMLIGGLVIMIQYTGMFFSSTSVIQNFFFEVKKQMAGLDRIISIWTHKSTSYDDCKEIKQINEIVLQDLSFVYDDGNVVFEGANAVFTKGHINCIIGKSGSGKSTLMKLLMGLYMPQRGKITFGEMNLTNNISEEISFVPQDNVFFTDSIYNNLVMNSDISKDQVYQICKKCMIHDEILNCPDGYDTIMSKAINNLSGGQIKRLSIARALLQNRNILLMDEPFTGLDGENSTQLVRCINEYVDSKIIILISHINFENMKNAVFYKISDKKIFSNK